jgi:hypothetical protein
MTDPGEGFSDVEMREMLALIDHPVPRVNALDVIERARTRSDWRSALLAACALFAVSSVAAATVHGTFVPRLLERMHRAPSRAHSVQVAPEATIAENASRGIAFVPGAQVEIEFRAAQRSGVVQVRWADGSSVLLTQTGAEGDAHYALTPTGVIVENERSVASYTLVLPRALSRARVRVAGREVLSKNGETVSCGGARDDRGICTIALGEAGKKP